MSTPSREGTHETPDRGDKHGGNPDLFNDQSGTARENLIDGGGVADGVDEVTKSAFERWLVKLELKAPSTKTKYLKVINGLLKFCGHRSATRVTDTDIQRYLNTLPGRPSREAALAAIKGFLKVVGRTVGDVDLGPKHEARQIEPIPNEDLEKMIATARTLRDRVLIMLLKDTGGRNSAICDLRVEDFKGSYIILAGDRAKNHITSLAPLSKRTQEATIEYLKTIEGPKLFDLTRSGLWQMVSGLGKKAGVKVYPHLFRHMRALEFRREKAQEDAVLNAMGWTDSTQYNRRYGRRPALETLKDARPKDPVEETPAKAIEKLAVLLQTGMIDQLTFQAAIVALQQRPQTRTIPGYQ